MNSNRWKRIAAALLAFCAFGTVGALAQETDERREWRREMRRTEEQRESLGVWFVHRLRSQLGLSKEQTLELLPHVEAIEEARAESAQRRRELAIQLEQIWRGEGDAGPDLEAEVIRLMRALDDEDARARAEQNRLRDGMLAVLEPRQRAGFVLFANRLRARLESKAFGRGDGRPPRAPRDPPDRP